MKVLLAHPGTQHSFILASQLHQRNLLSEFWTCFGLAGDGGFAKALKLLPSSIRQRFDNRIVPDLPSRKLRTLPWLERKALRQLSQGLEAEKVMLERNSRFQESIANASIENVDVVIGFDTSSWLLVDRASRAGKKFVLDQTTSHPQAGRAAWNRACEDSPEWRENAPVALESMLANQNIEHEGADLIVAASSFARETLIANGVAPAKVRVNPYGVDLHRFHPDSKSAARPMRFVFVGAMTARKGVPTLLAAWKKLQPKDAELWLVGEVSESVRKLIPDLRGLKTVGRKSRTELPELLRSCDVFVLPSYCEGFGLVLLEAMASGLPVLTTTATAAPDIVTEGRDGFIIESGDLDALVNKMEFCLKNRDRITEMGAAARATAERFSWDAYDDRWKGILSSEGLGGKW
jgi:alpha-maltose-1-phosphate synthase